MDVKLFVSAVSVEFDALREPIRHALARHNVSVLIQEDLKAAGVSTLVKLYDNIQTCQAVIHLVGDACGDDPPAESVRALLKLFPEITARLPGLAGLAAQGVWPTYTQWEAWLALYLGKHLYIAQPGIDLKRAPGFVRNEAHAARQVQHLQALAHQGLFPEIRFDTVESLNAQLLASPILDLLIDASNQASDRATQKEFALQEKRAGLPVPFFRYLWRELGSRVELLGKLAIAVRSDMVDALAATLASPQDDAPEADLLRDAWYRVQMVRGWTPLAEALNLPLSRWQDLARIVADTDARPAPHLTGLNELLLWALDLGERERAHAAFVQLLWLAAETRKLDAEFDTPSSADAIVEAISANANLSVHLAKAQLGPRPPKGPVRIYVELDLPLGETRPVLQRYWVQHQSGLVPGEVLPASSSLGEQLHELTSAVKHQCAREVQVELLAPLLLLCAQREWTCYCAEFGEFAGLANTTVNRDFCEDWPVSWRWRDRLERHPKCRIEDWHQRSAQVTATAAHCKQLLCRFEDEPVDESDAHLLGLLYVPPAPTQKKRNLHAFFDALIMGHPYMLWRSDEGIDNNDFKATVRACIAKCHIPQLPEAIRRARKAGQLRHAVLFIDDPTRNPYERMGRLVASDSSSS